MTNLLQPADIGHVIQIKLILYTGIPVLLDMFLAILWLSDIWENIPTHQMINSFDSCGITGNNLLHTTLKKEEDILGFEEGDELFENGANEKKNETETDDHLPEINAPIQSFQIEPLSSNAAAQETLPSQSIGEIPITHNYASNNFLNRYEAYEPFNYHQPNLIILPFQSKSFSETPQPFRPHLVLPQSVLAQSVLPESVLAKSVLDKQCQKDQLVSKSTPKLVRDYELRYQILDPPLFDSSVNISAGEKGKSICFGDSRGPLVVKVDEKWQLAGIPSWVLQTFIQSCYDGGAFTKTSVYINWIKENIQGN
ncbi:plasma kallikrein [Brachionus plicatilis]|uniref:Plasma kallikrein n=1 Tax=Brachionus plicatilis TaxID=10195 RepID=A0A3M7R3D3_BRAPC|nr:plasma kallikrein [Brachionus plicatilis]